MSELATTPTEAPDLCDDDHDWVPVGHIRGDGKCSRCGTETADDDGR